jgi:hypothetical protein
MERALDLNGQVLPAVVSVARLGDEFIHFRSGPFLSVIHLPDSSCSRSFPSSLIVSLKWVKKHDHTVSALVLNDKEKIRQKVRDVGGHGSTQQTEHVE